MKSKVLWIIGPALGHIGRSLLVARRLKSDHGIDSEFCGLDLHNYQATLLGNEFKHYHLHCQKEEIVQFAELVHRQIADSQPDVICFDCSPLPWLAALGRVSAPAIFITNWFLTSLGSMITLQDEMWNERSDFFKQLRKERQLEPCLSARDLYELGMQRVLLADPFLFLPEVKLPNHFRVVGPCSWEPETAMPSSLSTMNKMIYIAMGSTGERPLPTALIDALVTKLEPDWVVGAGKTRLVADSKVATWFDKLPASKVLGRSLICLTHGGTGSTYQALSFGVPLACWPTHRNQSILADQVEKLHLGVHLTPEGWPQQIDSLVDHFNQIKSHVQQFAQVEIDGPSNAAKEIVEVINVHRKI